MESPKNLAIIVTACLPFIFLKQIVVGLDFSLLGIAIFKIILLGSYGVIIYRTHPQALKQAVVGRPRNSILFLLLIPSFVLYANGFDIGVILTNITADYRVSLFEFQRIFLSAALEEFLFRIIVFYGILCILNDVAGSVWKAILLSSVVFGLCHLNNIGVIGLRSTVLQSYGAFALGFLLCILYLETNNILTVLTAHFLINYFSHFSDPATNETTDIVTAVPTVISFIFTIVFFSIPFFLGLLAIKYRRKEKFHVYPSCLKYQIR